MSNPQIRAWWRDWQLAFPQSVCIIGLVMLIRAVGGLQALELQCFDWAMRHRLPEPLDQRIVLVGIDEQDIQSLGQYPISDDAIATTLTNILATQPRAVGLDLFKDQINTPERQQLGEMFRSHQNLIGIEVALNADQALNVPPPPELPPEQVGFADALVDADGNLRRVILASYDWDGQLRQSLALRLANLYLTAEGMPLKTQDDLDQPIQFGTVTLSPFTSNGGGYHQVDDHGNQVLVNFSSAPQPFRVVPLRQVLAGTFEPEWFHDRIVLIGMMAPSVKDTFETAALHQTLYSLDQIRQADGSLLMYGLEVHAHALHHILGRVLSGRSEVRSLPDAVEYLLIFGLGCLGYGLGLLIRSPWKTLVAVAMALVGLALGSILTLGMGLWVPLLPAAIALLATGLTTTFLDRDSQRLLEERRQTISKTFAAVHNGPIQSLAALSRSVEQGHMSETEIAETIRTVDRDLRGLYDTMAVAAVTQTDRLYLQSDLVLDLRSQLSELLYELIDHTLNRPFPQFETLVNSVIPDFCCLDPYPFTPTQKRNLCLFIEECLCNAGKHAQGLTYLRIKCSVADGQYFLSVQDNGHPTVAASDFAGQGTRQAQHLAQQLGGQFERCSLDPTTGKGTICRLTWRQSRTAQMAEWLQNQLNPRRLPNP